MTKTIKQLPLLAGLAAFVLALAIGRYFLALEQDRDYQALRAEHQASIGLVRAQLEAELNSNLFIALGLSSFVAALPDFSPVQFEQMAAMLIRLRPNIRNIGLAPDNVIRYMHPLEGNRQALGLSYLDHPEQRQAVLQMMAEKQPVLAGPVPLLQGGMGLINRIPIHPSDQQGVPYYWGLASVVIDPEPIYESAGLNDPRLVFALRGKDALGAQGEMIRGEAELFDDPQAVIMEVVVPGGRWQLAGRVAAHRPGPVALVALLNRVLWMFAFVCGLMAWLAVRDNLRIRDLALHDSLTGVPNRRYLQHMTDRLIAQARRSGRAFVVLHLDIDDFKRINDLHGHKAGDLSLIFAAHQAQRTLRAADFVARVGGDEFVVLLPETDSNAELHRLIARLRANICSPFDYDGRLLSLSISIGWAAFPADGEHFEQLIKKADDTMYRAKASAKTIPIEVSHEERHTHHHPSAQVSWDSVHPE